MPTLPNNTKMLVDRNHNHNVAYENLPDISINRSIIIFSGYYYFFICRYICHIR